MNASIQRPPQPAHFQEWKRPSELRAGGQTPSQAQTGTAAGTVRTEVNVASLLAQSAEELTQVVATRVAERTLKERKLTQSGVPQQPTREQLKALQEALNAAREANRGRAGTNPAQAQAGRLAGEQAAVLIKKAKERPSSLLKEVADEVGADPTDQYLALLDMAYRFQDSDAGGDPGGKGQEAVWAALEELSAEKGEQIRADLNTFEAMRNLEPGQAGTVRAAYKDVVLASESLADASKKLLEATKGDTGEAFLKTLQVTISALGMDLASIRSSAEPAKLKALLTDLLNLETLATVVDRCHELGQTLSARHGAPPLRPTALAADLVALSGERWMDSGRFTRLGDIHGAQHSPSTAVDLLTGMRNALRELPTWSFNSSESRDSVLEAAQDAMDAAIDREEGFA